MELMSKGKHLTNSQRIIIEKGLNDNEPFASIARKVSKDSSTISKEVRRHIVYRTKKELSRDIPCALRKDCEIRFLCLDMNCARLCKSCHNANMHCTKVCPEYKEKECIKLKKPPYVCNGCVKKSNCLLKKSFYYAKYADECYRDLLVSSREGINQTPADIAILDELISPLLKKGQSLAHIYANHGSKIPFSRRTLYNYIDKSVFTARNIDLRRRVRYKARRKPTSVSLSAREFRVGRSYEDFQNLLKHNPNIPVVEMDTLVGGKGKGSKVFLTMLFRNCSLVLIFLLKDKTSESVIEGFDYLSDKLGIEVFRELFQVILTDNGAEFQRPERLEFDSNGKKRSSIYYCNPHSSWQKGMIEKNHEYIRLVVPKGYSLDSYSESDVTLLMNHINSESRDRLNGCTPIDLSLMLLNNKLHNSLGLTKIDPDEVTLSRKLFM